MFSRNIAGHWPAVLIQREHFDARSKMKTESPALFLNARQHYRDFLNREPDTNGLAFWTSEINLCGSDPGCIQAKRINVSAAYFLSIEFQQTGYLVYRMYKAAYGNLLDAPVPVKFNEFLPDAQEIGHG